MSVAVVSNETNPFVSANWLLLNVDNPSLVALALVNVYVPDSLVSSDITKDVAVGEDFNNQLPLIFEAKVYAPDPAVINLLVRVTVVTLTDATYVLLGTPAPVTNCPVPIPALAETNVSCRPLIVPLADVMTAATTALVIKTLSPATNP